ncbi:MAG: carbamoyltransferase HypF [Candidatus Hodarchaeota archaeon]
MKAVMIDIEGIVQGVGFRPFLFNLARDHHLVGEILNRGNAGVRVFLEGSEDSIDKFIQDIKEKAPAISRVDNVRITRMDQLGGYERLTIKKSEDAAGPSIVLPADIATCDDCLAEMQGKGPGGNDNKYFKYPFVACTYCGPRFTTVVDLPYDRERTTMIKFPLCTTGKNPCQDEYTNTDDRRFHAQTFACSACGPHYHLEDGSGEVIVRKLDAIEQTAMLLAKGNIVAMKGIGGVHLLADARKDDVLASLRKRKRRRKEKPFALMAPSLDVITKYVNVSRLEEKHLTSHRRPIVLLKRNDNQSLSRLVAPGLSRIGFMLPYMGTHHLLLDFCKDIRMDAIVFTSGNISGLPMAITNEDISVQLKDMADYFLLHDRTIQQRCDDSVGKVVANEMLLIRRSRGYIPEFIPSPVDTGSNIIIATGPELFNTAAIYKGNKIFVSQYIGDVVNLETLNYLESTINHFKRLLRVNDEEITAIACDAHPSFYSSELAREMGEKLGKEVFPVYHHQAHCGALVVDNRLDPEEPLVFVTCDGVGYGEDGNAWGGEMFKGTLMDLQHVVRLEYQRMPGGDLCALYPARMLASILSRKMNRLELQELLVSRYLDGFKGGEKEIEIVLDSLYSKEILPMTSSMGRVLDAASAALRACKIRTYEGEPAMKLESLADLADDASEEMILDYISMFKKVSREKTIIIDFSDALLNLAHESFPDHRLAQKGKHARSFQLAIGRYLGEIAVEITRNSGINGVGVSGGVAYNSYIVPEMKHVVKNAGLQFYQHSSLPPGDGGVSAGQALLSYLKYKSS